MLLNGESAFFHLIFMIKYYLIITKEVDRLPKQCWADCHTHTNYSPDGSDSAVEMCARACELGLTYYTITDHCECNDFQGQDYGFNYEKGTADSYLAITQAAKMFNGKLQVLKGIELGQPLQCETAANQALQRAYDFVLGSVHNITGYEDFYFLNYNNVPDGYIDNLMKIYFQEILDTARCGKIDSLAHLTYPMRYITGDHGYQVDLNRYHGLIDDIFDALVQRQIALEINTSGLRQNIGVTLPDQNLLKWYYDRGGRLVTIGSDAHTTGDLGYGLKSGLKNLYKAGFREYAVYIKHTPKMISIIKDEIMM